MCSVGEKYVTYIGEKSASVSGLYFSATVLTSCNDLGCMVQNSLLGVFIQIQFINS